MTYQAPIRDMNFIMKALADADQLCELPGCEEASSDLMQAVLEEAGKFAAGVLAPLNKVGDEQGCRVDEDGTVHTPDGWDAAYQQFCEDGWLGLSLPVEYGGQGLPKTLSTPVWEMWSSANHAWTMLPMLALGETEALMIAGSEEQKALWLPKIVSGEWACTMNLTEPQAGSDLAATRTKAEPQADGSYKLTGQKIYISYGDHTLTENIVHLVLARLPDAPPGVKGLSLFVVPKFLPDAEGNPGSKNDIRCISIEHKMGIHGSPTCTLAFGAEQGGATGWLVGEENLGLRTMFIMMNDARFGVGGQGVALAESAYQMAVDYARERVQGRNAVTGATDAPIVHHPDVKRMLLGMRARILAMRCLLYVAGGWFDQEKYNPDEQAADKARRYIDLLMPVIKGWNTETGNAVCYDAIQVFGGMGFVEETGVAQFYRDARITTIYEGTTGIQANDLIGRKIQREGGETLGQLIDEISDVASKLSESGADAMAANLRAQITALGEARDFLLREEPAATLPSAVPFLHLMGVVCGSWQMARLWLAAGDSALRDEFGVDWLDSLRATAEFFLATWGPQAQAYSTTVQSSGVSLTAFEDVHF